MSGASIQFNFQNARGTLADIPTLSDGQFYWAEDTQQLYIGTAASGNVAVTPGGGVFPISISNVAHKWLNSYDAATGLFTQTQPAFSDLSGSIATGQIPAGTVTVAQISATGIPSSSTFLRGDGSWATASGGSSVSVNGSAISSPNFNGTTPSAPGGNTNVVWQFDGSGNVSAYFPSSLPPNGSAGGDLSGTYPNPTVAKINGGTVPLSKTIVGTNGSGQIVDATSTTLPTAMFPALTGDVTNSAGSLSTTVGKVNGATIPISKTIVGTNSSGQIVDATSATLTNNTSGTAANLSGTPALPNGTTATTQSAGDSTNKLATTGFVQAALPIISQTFTLSASDLINSGTTPFTLVTPSGSQGVIPVSAALAVTTGGNPYEGSNAFTFGYTGMFGFFVPFTMQFPVGSIESDSVVLAVPLTSVIPNPPTILGKPFVFTVDTGGGPIVTFSLGSSGGAGYAPGDLGTISSGNGGATYVVDTVDGGGGVLTFHLSNNGGSYLVAADNPTFPDSGGGDGSLLINVDSITVGNGTAKLTLLYYLVTA